MNWKSLKHSLKWGVIIGFIPTMLIVQVEFTGLDIKPFYRNVIAWVALLLLIRYTLSRGPIKSYLSLVLKGLLLGVVISVFQGIFSIIRHYYLSNFYGYEFDFTDNLMLPLLFLFDTIIISSAASLLFGWVIFMRKKGTEPTL